MTITGILSGLIIGTIIGAFGRLVIPGRVPIPIWLTIVTGVVAAFLGTGLTQLFGLSTSTPGIDWIELIVQVVVAAVGVYGVGMLSARLYARSIRHRSPSRYAGGPEPLRERPPTPPPVSRPVQAPPTPTRRTPERRTKVFLSYRRSDTPYAARGVADQLRRQLGPAEVFMDVDSIAPGLDFIHGVQNAIQGSAVMLVLIGDRWLDARDHHQRRRLDEPDDNVRCEIEQALQMQCRILPVLVDQATMPSPNELPPSLEPLRRFNAVRVRHDSWDDDLAKLSQAVAQLRAHP